MAHKDVLQSIDKDKEKFLKQEKDKEKILENYVVPHANHSILKWELIMIMKQQKLIESQGLPRTISHARIKR